jgi:formylglycine-generating enzyme required for sulfatase activity
VPTTKSPFTTDAVRPPTDIRDPPEGNRNVKNLSAKAISGVPITKASEQAGSTSQAQPAAPPAAEPNPKSLPPQQPGAVAKSEAPAVTAPPTIINSIRMKLALIPAGEFLMGSPDPNAPGGERPEHKVRISTPFFLAVTEVTQAQYAALIGPNPSYFSATGGGKDIVKAQPTGDYPVEQVSWFDAILFCNALTQRERLAPYYQIVGDNVRVINRNGPGYRLPTEAEWEYAVRAGRSGRFPADVNPMFEYGWYGANSNGSTHPVGKKLPNEFGVYDMHGNVFEWCFDGYDVNYFKNSPEVDPTGPTGMSTKVTRGGGWRSPGRHTYSARFSAVPQQRHFVTGFRVARTQVAQRQRNQPAAPGNPRSAVGKDSR